MAKKYRKIDPRIWSDEKFTALDEVGKLIAIYCLTSPQGNRIGLFKFSVAMAAEDLGMPTDTYAIRFAQVCDTFNWAFDSAKKVLFLPTWWKYNCPDNSNHLAGCLEDLHDIPKTQLIQEFAKTVQYLPETYRERFANVCDTFAIRIPSGAGAGAGDIPVAPAPGDDDQKTGPTKVSRIGRPTWLTPFVEIWKDNYGGELPCGEAASALKRPVAELGADEVAGRFKQYCKKTKASFASVHKFASTIGSWGAPRPVAAEDRPFVC